MGSREGSIESSAEVLWTEVSARLRHTVSETTFRTFFSAARPLELTDGALVVSVQNEFVRGWIESHFLGLMDAAVRDTIGQERHVQLTVEAPEEPAPAATDQAASDGTDDSGVTPKYTFDSFVIGSSNRFAGAAALAVAEAPARAYNPLFIYGDTGLGKSHLLHAIAHYVGEHSRGLSVHYVTSETFMNDFINSLRDKLLEGFKRRYRNYDVLLIDDIQFFEGRERTQEEFFHTFNSLHGSGSQIVISSDRPPRQLSTLEARLRSRFEWGLLTDIQPPDLETRIAILRKKVSTDNIYVADPELLTFIASRISTNIRALEGALTRVVAFSSLTERPMTSELAQEVLRNVFPEGEAADISIERIQEAVSKRFDISVQELTGHERSRPISYPRHVAMYLCRELTDSSLPKIGKEFGGRDHTTVMYATSKIARLIREKRDVYNLVQDLTARIGH
ncbi:MAG TPA: chromosomal replication initiator protein DnaA [Gaiellaceae bacterium]|nr:chromosomal replication initiator protein DnaA [Gaiellaceae bacterium]